MIQRKSVSVVIPTRNREESLSECLRRLLADSPTPDEIIVVDTSSSDATRRTLERYPGVFHHRLGDLRYSLVLARNAGLSIAAGEVVAFLDDDSYVRPGWLGEILAVFDDPGIVAAGGRAIAHPWKSTAHGGPVAGLHFEKDLIWGEWDRTADGILDVPHLYGANFAVRRNAALEVGGFDSNFTGSGNLEETDFFYRLSKMGGRIVFVPTAAVEHRFAPRPDGMKRSQTNYVFRYSMVRNRLYFLRKHGELRGFAIRRQIMDAITGTGKYLLDAAVFALASVTGIMVGLSTRPVGRNEGLEGNEAINRSPK